MIDYFALLQESRRPWMDEGALKQKFLALSTTAHPDRFHSVSPAEKEAAHQNYLRLNAAYNCLRQPKERLRHLLELERGSPVPDLLEIPPGAMDAFIQAGRLCKEADAFLVEKRKTNSPLLKVRIFQKSMEWTDRLTELQKDLECRRAECETELRELNRFWETAPRPGEPERAGTLPLARLEEIHRELAFLLRWLLQVQERLVQLALT